MRILPSADHTPTKFCRVILAFFFAAVAILPVGAQTGNTALIVSGPQDDPITSGGSYYYTPNDGTFTLTEELNPTVDGFRVRFAGSPLGVFWDFSFEAPTGQLLQVGEYENCQRFASDTAAGFDVGGFLTSCDHSGSFIVHELGRDMDGNIEAFHISFQQSCFGDPPLAGEIFYNSSHQLPPPPIPTPTVKPGQVPVISVSVSPKNITEGSDAVFTFTAKPAFALPTSVGFTYRTSGSREFSLNAQYSIHFGAGVSTHTVTLHTFADVEKQKKQRFTMRVMNVPIYKVGTKNGATVTISDPTH